MRRSRCEISRRAHYFLDGRKRENFMWDDSLGNRLARNVLFGTLFIVRLNEMHVYVGVLAGLWFNTVFNVYNPIILMIDPVKQTASLQACLWSYLKFPDGSDVIRTDGRDIITQCLSA